MVVDMGWVAFFVGFISSEFWPNLSIDVSGLIHNVVWTLTKKYCGLDSGLAPIEEKKTLFFQGTRDDHVKELAWECEKT